jgi:hypothetical protein
VDERAAEAAREERKREEERMQEEKRREELRRIEEEVAAEMQVRVLGLMEEGAGTRMRGWVCRVRRVCVCVCARVVVCMCAILGQNPGPRICVTV